MPTDLLSIILADETLSPFFCDNCNENGVGVNFDPSLQLNKDYIIIKVDDYYNSNFKNPNIPPSPDCIIIQKCHDERYVIYIVELKSIQSLGPYNLRHIRDKFQTCLSHFMSDLYRKYFYASDLNFHIKLLFICDLFTGNNDKFKTTKLDNLLALPHCSFANNKYNLEHKIPSPIVRPC